MKAVTTALIPSGESFHFGFGPEDEGIKNSVFSELERLLRMDRWVPSFQYTVSQAALAAKEQLSLKGIGTLTFSELLLYTREGVFDVLRGQTFDILLNLGALRHPPLVKFLFFTLRNDPSLFIRHRLVRSIGSGFGSMALTGNVQAKNQTAGDEMVIEEDAAQSVAVRKDLLERASISGAIQALRKELSADETLKEELWNCAKYNLQFVFIELTLVHHNLTCRFVNMFLISVEFYMTRKPHTWSFCNCRRKGNDLYVITLARYFRKKIDANIRAKLLCVGSIRVRYLRNGSQLLLL